jgi:hypothetical protein
MFCFNYPNGFLDKVFENNHNASHFEQKFIRAYESASSIGAVNKFFTELSGDNQKLLTDWVYDNYKGSKFAEGGEAGDEIKTYRITKENAENEVIYSKDYSNLIDARKDIELPIKEGGMTFIRGYDKDNIFVKVFDRRSNWGDKFAEGGEAGEKSNKNIRKKRTKSRQPKIVRQYFEDEAYTYSDGGGVDLYKDATEKSKKEIEFLLNNGYTIEAYSEEDRDLVFGEDDNVIFATQGSKGNTRNNKEFAVAYLYEDDDSGVMQIDKDLMDKAKEDIEKLFGNSS